MAQIGSQAGSGNNHCLSGPEGSVAQDRKLRSVIGFWSSLGFCNLREVRQRPKCTPYVLKS